MQLLRFGPAGKEKPGVAIDGQHYDVSPLGEDYDEKFFGTGGLERLKGFVSRNKTSLDKVPAGARLGSPIARPSKIVCIGLNYADHAKESGAKIPEEPILFMKSTTSLVGPNDEVMIPKNSVKTDWEVELAVIIGAKASYVSEADAMKHVAGYCLHNDVSEREFQLERGGTWDKGKGSTSDLIFKVPFLISYLSQFMTLLPGDVISTGTPKGVGLGFNPPIYLKPGDVMELGIDGMGVSKQKVVAWRA